MTAELRSAAGIPEGQPECHAERQVLWDGTDCIGILDSALPVKDHAQSNRKDKWIASKKLNFQDFRFVKM